jgi:DNA-binding transcriptional LysR family regulator
MINRGAEMEVFVRVVEMGSFSAAARALHLTPSAVSKLVTRIEERLGVPLVIRSTRNLQLTPEGQLMLERAQRIVSEIEQTERAVASGSNQPRGPLRVNANIPFATHYLLPLIPEFLGLYPGITLDFTMSDFPVDLIYERADVAIRTGVLHDSSLKARKILESDRHVVGSPIYFARHGVPSHPRELASHNCLSFNIRRNLDVWPFKEAGPDGSPFELFVTGNMRMDNGETMRKMALAGLGIARLSSFHVGKDIEAGDLIAVLEEFNPGDIEPIHAVYVDHEHLSNRIRVFVDFLAERIPRRIGVAAEPAPSPAKSFEQAASSAAHARDPAQTEENWRCP